ncbi:hypothetical protein HKX69_12760 [Streptomyces argyrophyllae]|uniref:Uncharacterized protein n=1 Tax=Streptomyces argyrophylli TaxID=2726118 RepID=A0A6M4PWA5_9ACTN|nr:hypothetical protein HKX69_12760 [Streptomyces argyrophyllae]
MPGEAPPTQTTLLRTTAVPTTGGVRLPCIRPGILDAWTAGTSSRTRAWPPGGPWTGGRS